MDKTATIYGINGPGHLSQRKYRFLMSEMVYVGKQKLVGEVIALDKDLTTVQVYEETSGLYPGRGSHCHRNPVSVTLAPGILNNIFDGIERPLEQIAESGRRCIYHPWCQRGFTGSYKKMAHPHYCKARRLSPCGGYHRRSSRDPCDHP